MRWLFLAFLALLAALGNFAIFESLSTSRAILGFAFNLFLLAMLIIWWSAYYSVGASKGRRFVIGHALFTLSLGLGFVGWGVSGVYANSCDSFLTSNNPHGLRNQLASYVESVGYCRELGVGFALFGLFLAYPSVRLFLGLVRKDDAIEIG